MKKGRRVTAVTSCQYSSCKARRYLGTGDTEGVKIRIRKEAKNGFGGSEEGF